MKPNFYTCPLIIASLLLLGMAHPKNATQDTNTITIAWDTKPRSLDPRYATDANSQYLEDLTTCSLFTFDANGELVGELAESYTWQNPLELHIALKPNIVFSDGSPVASNTVKSLYDYLSKEKSLSPRHGAFTNIKDIVAPSPNHLIFKLKEADAAFQSNLIVGIVPLKFSTSDQVLSVKDQPPTCGLFSLVSITPTEMILTKNPSYSLGVPAKSTRIIIKIIKDETTAYAKLKSGEIDLVQGLISRDKINAISSLPHITVSKKFGLNTGYLAFNMRDPLLRNKNLRQAIGYAINREAIIKYIMQDFATLAEQMFPPEHKYYSPSVSSFPHNLEKAQKLLAELKKQTKIPIPSSQVISLTYSTTTNITRIAIARAISAQLKKIDLDVKIDVSDWSRFKQNVEKGNVQMWSLSWIGFKDPDILNFAFSSKSFPPNGGNRGYFSTPILDDLLNRGKSTIEFATRKKIYDAAQEIIADEVPYIYLWHEDLYVAHKKNLQGYTIYRDGRYRSLAKVFLK